MSASVAARIKGDTGSLVSVAVTLQQVAIRVDAPIAQERPYPANMLAALHVDLAHQDFRIVLVGFGQEFALRAEHVAGPPELDARGAQRRRLQADAIAGQHRQAVGNGMAAMAEDPRIALAILFRLFVVRIPTD